MKRNRIFSTVLVSCCIFACFLSCKREGKNSNDINIGAIIPLSGYSAINGERFVKGLNLAIE